VLIARYVEHCSPSNQVSIAVNLFHLRRRFPISLAHHPVPRFKARLRVWVFLPELFESASFYDAHGEVGSHNENIKVKSPFVKMKIWLPEPYDLRTLRFEFRIAF
jgi:hypothetical protein